jgi:hypothetical protein
VPAARVRYGDEGHFPPLALIVPESNDCKPAALAIGHPRVFELVAWIGSQLVAVWGDPPLFIHWMVWVCVIVTLAFPLASLKPQFGGLAV